MHRRNGPVIKPWSQSGGQEGNLWWERFLKEVRPELWVKEGAMEGESGELTEWEDVVGAWTGRTETEGLRWGWRRELFQRQGEAHRKKRSVIRSEDDVRGRARVTIDEERLSECCEEVEQRWGGGDMKVGWLWGLCKSVRGVCIRYVRLFWASEESVRYEWCDRN